MPAPRIVRLMTAVIGSLFSVALLAGCQRTADPGTPHGSFQHFDIHNDEVIVHAPGKPDATINAAGDLSIAGKPLDTTPAQRQLVKRYYTEVQGLRSDAIATGKQGLAVAGKAIGEVIGEVIGGLAGGDPDRIGGRIEAETAKIEAQTAQICVRLGAVRSVQEALASQLPALRPYATIRAEQVSSCSVDRKRPAASNPGEASALIDAVDAQRIEEVRRLVEHGADINAAVRGDGTALIRAAAHGDVAIVDELIRLGADVNQASRGDGNPLIVAANRGHAEIVAHLVDAGADVNAVVAGDETPLINAARGGHLGVVTYLVEHGADVNKGVVVDLGRWRSPLNQAKDDRVRAYLTSKGAVADRKS